MDAEIKCPFDPYMPTPTQIFQYYILIKHVNQNWGKEVNG